MIDAESSWCGTDAIGAVLINGGSDSMGFGVAVQTVAYRLQLPVLMTAADELPDATAEFITTNDVEHVQIIGGTGTVSADVASALTSLGVDTVARVDGDSASAVSVALAKLAGNGCGDSLGLVSNNMVALVRGNPDGVVAAPVLASSLAGGYLVPPLVVGDSLPASVSDYLAATPKTVGSDKLNLGIVAVGGTAAVSQATMDAARAAAASAGALTVQIGASSDTNLDGATNADDPVRPDTTTAIGRNEPLTGPGISLYFSDDVASDLAKLQDIIEINGVPAVVLAATPNAGRVCDQRRIDVTPGSIRAAVDGGTIDADGNITPGTAGGGLGLNEAEPSDGFAAPARVVRYEGETVLVKNLPKARDLIATEAGARLHGDNPATTAKETDYRPAEDPVANGFSADVNTTAANAKVDEGRNGASQVRISVSSSIKARN